MPELNAIGRYNRQAKKAARIGRIDEALVHLAQAMRLAREARQEPLEACLKCRMGEVYMMYGRMREAALCFRIALDMALRIKDSRHPLCRAIADRLASVPDRPQQPQNGQGKAA